MDKKLPLGIKILSAIFMVSSIWTAVSLFLWLPKLLKVYEWSAHDSGRIVGILLFPVLSLLLNLGASIGLLRFKKWGLRLSYPAIIIGGVLFAKGFAIGFARGIGVNTASIIAGFLIASLAISAFIIFKIIKYLRKEEIRSVFINNIVEKRTVTDTRRSIGVTIFGWLIIILNIISFLSSLNYKSFFNLYKSFPANIIITFIVYSAISSIVCIIAGVGILKLKESMRKVAIFITTLDIFVAVTMSLLGAKDFQQYCYAQALLSAPRGASQEAINMLASISFYIITILNWGFIVLGILLIFFFTRPKVKEQFK